MKKFPGKLIGSVAAILLTLFVAGCVSTGPEGVRTQSDMTDAQRRASIRLQLAAGYYQQGEWKVALDEVKKVLAVDPDNVDGYNIRGMIYMQMHETKLAEDSFLRALSLDADNPEVANNYGLFLCQTGQVEKSLYHFEKAVQNRTYRSPATALNNAGVCSLKLKKDKQAEEYFNRAFKFDAGNPVTNANLAKLYYVRGAYDRAHFYMNRVMNVDALTAEMLWTAINIERKRGDRAAEGVYVAHLRRLYPKSQEFSAYQRGMFDE